MSVKRARGSESMVRQGKGKELALTGLMAALFCVVGPLSVPLPFSPVPISLTNLAIYFSLYILGMKRGCFSYLIYLLIGFTGVPVFSAFTGGPGILLGPTGGYLVGFILMAMMGGFCIDRWPERHVCCFLSMAAGTCVCYLFGTVWLAVQAKLTFAQALASGVLPFIAGDILKIFLAMAAGPTVRRRLTKAGLN